MLSEDPYPLRTLLEAEVVVDVGLVLSGLAVVAWFLGVAASSGFWVAYAFALVALCALLVGLKHVDESAREIHATA